MKWFWAKFLLVPLLVCASANAEIGNTNIYGTPKVFGGSSGLIDKTMNPAISLNGLFLGRYGSASSDKGFQIQEVEAVFTASVDPYFFGNFVFSSEGGAAPELEEGYVSTLSIPMVDITVGKYRLRFGKSNRTHSHALPLIDRPLVCQRIFGEDGVSGVGIWTSWLVPVPWYFDFALTVFSAGSSNLFNHPSSETLAFMLRQEHLFDLSDETTLSFGASYAGGPNDVSEASHYIGGDLTLKYISGNGRGTFGVSWENEFLYSVRNGGSGSIGKDAWGLYSTALARLSRVFWVGGRFDFVNLESLGESTTGENLVVAYVPSEFSAIRIQGGLSQSAGATTWTFLAQLNTNVGSHPAHAY